MARLGTSPIVKNSGLTHFGPRSGRQIMRLLFHRTGQEPQVVLRSLFKLLRILKRIIKILYFIHA